MNTLTLLRRLAEQHDYSALQENCLGADSDDPAVQVLLALAEVRLGDPVAARCILESLDPNRFDFATRVDLAGLYIALEQLEQAIAVLELTRCENTGDQPRARALLLARLAWCRLRQGQHEEAVALYEQSLTIEPLLAVYRNLLWQYRDSGRLVEMQACLHTANQFWAVAQLDWPDDQRVMHSRQFKEMQLDLWLAANQLEAAEAWVESQRDVLDEHDWSAMICAFAERLAARDRHAQAEEWLRAGLRRYPENLLLHSQLAELAQLLGRALQAIGMLRRAIRLADAGHAPTHALWLQLSSVALQANPALARAAVEKAFAGLVSSEDESADRRLQVELAMASVEAQEQDHAAAEQRYQQVLEQQPRLIPALRGLGQLYLQLGRIDDAVLLFERIKTIDPSAGHGALINARRFPEDDATLLRLEQLARTPSMQGSVRTGLLFQLAAAWEQRQRYPKAFTLAAEANAASRNLLRYDAASHRAQCARIRHAFPTALYEHRANSGLETTLPVFVVGMPRSGTTLVEQIVAGHSRIQGAGELGLMPQLIARLERWERHTGSGRCYPDCVDDLDPAVIQGIAGHALQELTDYAPEAAHVVDKLPHNFENIGLIKLLFPQAKIISVRRDPRDVAVSNYFTDYAAKHSGMGFAYDLDWIGEQLADHNLLMRHWHQVFPGEILEIEYEHLVDDPESSARRLLEYIDVDWESQVLDFHSLQRPIKTASAWQVRQPLYTSSKFRWRRYQQHMKPLVAATNRPIKWDPIEMVTLPEPGWLNKGVDHYRQGDLDAAEYRFKQLRHHLPEHAAAGFMLGLIYVRKGHRSDGIRLMEQALERCPWNSTWRSSLARAYRQDGREADASALTEVAEFTGDDRPMNMDYLYTSEPITSEAGTCADSAKG